MSPHMLELSVSISQSACGELSNGTVVIFAISLDAREEPQPDACDSLLPAAEQAVECIPMDSVSAEQFQQQLSCAQIADSVQK